ncbi:MAG: nucleotidyltransferase domain-containing protein [archaeon]
MKVDYTKKLEEFIKKLKEIPEILAVFYTGSTARKSWDKYSDIDIDVVVRDKNYEKIVNKLPKILSMWGEIRLTNYYKGCDENYAFIDKEYTKVEIDPIKISNLKSDLKFKDITIEFDKEGTLKKVHKKSQKLKRSKINIKEFNHILLDTRSNFLYIARHYARGQKFSGVEEITRIRWDLFFLLSKLKGLEGYELIRDAEKLLSKREWILWMDSHCKNYEKNELIRAIKSNWNFMKYIEREYERLTKTKLRLKCNDDEILEVINKTLN